MSESRWLFSVTAASLSDDARQAPLLARRLGFGGLVYDAFLSSLNLPDLSQSGRRDFRHMLAAHDQALVALRVDAGPKGLGPGADVDRALARLGRVMEAAAALGPRLVCVDLGPLPRVAQPAPTRPKITPEQAGLIILPTMAALPAPTADDPPSQAEEMAAVQIESALVELGKQADRYGTALALSSELAGPHAIEHFLKLADCPWFGVDLDPPSLFGSEWDLDECFSRLGSQVKHLRARDALKGQDGRTRSTILGKGDVNWAHLLGNLQDAGYQGWITVDTTDLPDRAGAAAAGIAFLRGVRV